MGLHTVSRLSAWMRTNPLLTMLIYYSILFAAAFCTWELIPGGRSALKSGTDLAQGLADSGSSFVRFGTAATIDTIVAMTAATLLTIPVGWIYHHTRERDGFRQALVHTLLILPVVVAGVAILVKSSVALAFSLGGIVAAVNFRNTLKDTKDAVYVFLVTGIGLAAGVQGYGVAAAISVFFNMVILVLWRFDIGSVPTPFAGTVRDLRVRQALAMPQHTDEFRVFVDRELERLDPRRIEVVAQTARRKSREVVAMLPRPAEQENKAESKKAEVTRERQIVISVPDKPADVRRVAEDVLDDSVKRWRFVGQSSNDKGHTLRYKVKLRKKVAEAHLASQLEFSTARWSGQVEVA